jgi:hypothetical protein
MSHTIDVAAIAATGALLTTQQEHAKTSPMLFALGQLLGAIADEHGPEADPCQDCEPDMLGHEGICMKLSLAHDITTSLDDEL